MVQSGFKRFGPRARTVSLVAAACVLAQPMGAQENAAEENFGITLSQTVRIVDNIRLNESSVGTTSAADTDARFGYRFGDGLQTLTLRGLATLRLQDDPVLGSDIGLSDSNVNLAYLRDGAHARLALQSQYLRTDLLFSNPLQSDEITEEDLSDNTGRRSNTNTNLQFETGLQSVLGLRLTLSQRDRRYSGTVDPDFFDTKIRSADITLPWRLSETSEAQLNYFHSRYEAEDAERTDRDTERFTIGLTHRVSPISSLSFYVGRSEVVETFGTFAGVEDVDEGTIYNLSWNRALPNGSLVTSYTSDITQSGRRSRFQVERQLDLPDGELVVSVGTSDGSESSLRPIGSVRWRKENTGSRFTAALSRASVVSTTSSEVTETTRLNLGYGLDLNALSTLNFDLRYANIKELDGPATEEDRRRASFDVSLNRQVTEDWNLITGYQFRHARRESGTSGNSNALFFTLRRDLGGLN